MSKRLLAEVHALLTGFYGVDVIDVRDGQVILSTDDENVDILVDEVDDELTAFVIYRGATLSGEDDYDTEVRLWDVYDATETARDIHRARVTVNDRYYQACKAEAEAFGDW